jgi:hypothetical protein
MTILVYSACFLALAALAGLAAASGRRWALRLPLLAATPVLALAVWWQLSQRDGWPTGSRPADGSAFVAGVVQAPTPGSAGAIYLWAQPPRSNAPRSYRLPYTSQLERQVAKAARAAKRGARVGLRAAGKPAHAKLQGDGRPKRDGRAHSGGQAQAAPVEFYRLPPAGLPSKNRSG